MARSKKQKIGRSRPRKTEPPARAPLRETEAMTRERLLRLAAAKQELARREARAEHAAPGGLIRFIRYFWKVLEPVTPFVDGWCLEGMCEHLEAVSDGRIKRLLLNVPPGFMKEVHVDEMVLTRRGRIRLGDVIVGDMILTHKGRYRRVTRIADKGLQPTLFVTTANGRRVRAEINHPFLTTRGWIAAKDLRIGDMLAAVAPTEEGMTPQMPPEEARLLGYIVGDGSVTHSPGFTNTDPDVLDDFERCAAACGLKTERHSPSPSQVTANFKATRIGIKGSLKLLDRHGLRGKSSYTKRIPPAVLASDAITIANFVGAYWSCDGHVKIRHKRKRGDLHMATCTTVSEGLARDIQHALLRLGINARLRLKGVALESKKQPGGTYWSFNIFSATHDNAVKFRDMPGLCPHKNAPLAQLTPQRFNQGPLYEDEIVEIEDSEPGECRCLTVDEDSSFTAGDLAVHNSLLLNVFWPAYEWGPRNRPDLRYVAFSYSSILTERDNEKFATLVSSPEYQALYGRTVQVTKDGVGKIMNAARGEKMASSIGGVGTGARGDRVILDDPHKVDEAESELVRGDTTRWFRESMQNRLNDAEESVIVVLGQRVNEADVSGVILDEFPEYDHYCVPMEYDGRDILPDGMKRQTSIGWEDPRWDDGELAWPERYKDKFLQTFRSQPYVWACQYMQSPEPRGGGIIKREYWRIWDREAQEANDVKPGLFPAFEFILASFDGAFTEKKENDYSALTVWGAWVETNPESRFSEHFGTPRLMLVHAWRKRLTLHGRSPPPRDYGESEADWKARCQQAWGVVEWIAHDCRRLKVDKLIIENKATGHTVEQEMRRLFADQPWSVALHDPGRLDKVARAYTVQHVFADGMVWRPDTDWAQLVEDELAALPRGAHDDLADSAINSIMHLRRMSLAPRREESHAAFEEALYPSTPPARFQHYES